MTRRKVHPRPRDYAIVQRAVEDGIRYGWRRVWKYHEGPTLPDDDATMDGVGEEMERAIMNELCEVWRFDD